MDLQAAQSIVAQRLRAVVVIPLYAMSRANTEESMVNIKRGEFLGVLYLDSRRPAAFSKLDRQILDALAAEPPASWTTRAWWSANANGSAWNRKSISRATFSRRCCRAISANFRTWRCRA